MPTGKLVKTAAQFAAIAIILLIGCSNARAQMSSDDVLPSGQKSDGCTLIADGDIRDCCIAHDKEYFQGGTRLERRASDKRLYECVCKKGGWDKFFAPFIWLGVRIGGLPFLPTKFRWGFGTKVKGYAKQPPVEKTPNNP
ncbi:MAG: hypothetical protein ACJ72Z_09445 [Pyrinomonadaceae bacterium]